MNMVYYSYNKTKEVNKMTMMYYDPKTKTMRFPVSEAIQNVRAEKVKELAELDKKEDKQNV